MGNNVDVKYVLFDLGNTLLYFEGSWHEVMQEALQSLTHCLHDCGYSVGDSFLDDFMREVKAYYIERDEKLTEYSLEYVLYTKLTNMGVGDPPGEHLRAALDAMYAVTEAHWHPEEDTISTLCDLRNHGYKIGLISNASDAKDVQNLIDKANIREFFDKIVISADVGIRKPHPKIFRLALAHWNADPREAVMVGDNLEADVLGAQRVGMASVWISRRASSQLNALQKGIQPDASIDALHELPLILKTWRGKDTDK